MARKNNFISSLVFLIDALSNLFKEIKKLKGDEQSFFLAFSDAEKIKQIAKIIVGEVKVFFSGNDYLKLISGDNEIVIDACDGTELLSEASDTFAFIDSDFVNYGANERGEAIKATKVKVYELIKDSNFSNLFASIGVPLDKMCFTQSQIKKFVLEHKHWLRTDGYATFFLFKSKGKCFVSRVDFDSDGKLEVLVYQLKYGLVWNAEFRLRVVLPQLEL